MLKQKEFNGPRYVANHINEYCRNIPIWNNGKKTGKTCPCSLSWLCDGVFNGKLRMSSPYDQEAQRLLEENFPKETRKEFPL